MAVKGEDVLVPLGEGAEMPGEPAWPVGPAKPVWPLTAMLGALLAVWVVEAAFTAQNFIRAPFADPHDWIAAVFATEKSHDWLGYLWSPHNNQRIVLARLFTAADVEALKGGTSSFLISTLVLQLAAAAAAASVSFLSLPRTPWRPWMAGLIGAAVLNIAFVEDATAAYASVYIYAAGFAALSVLAFALRGQLGWRRWMVALALGFGLLAACGNAAGLAIWPVLMWGAVRSPDGRPRLVVIAFGLAVIVIFALGLGAPTGEGRPAPTSALGHLLKMVSYFLGYLTLPWGGQTRIAVRVLGLGLAAAYGWVLAKGPRAGEGGVLRQAGLDLIAFALITAALATLGRVDELPQPIVPIRYAPFAMLGHAGLLMVLAPRLIRIAEARPRLAGAALVVVLAIAGGSQFQGARRIAQSVVIVRTAGEAFDRGDRSPVVVGMVYPRTDPESIKRVVEIRAELKRRGLPY